VLRVCGSVRAVDMTCCEGEVLRVEVKENPHGTHGSMSSAQRPPPSSARTSSSAPHTRVSHVTCCVGVAVSIVINYV